jgi:hypothetical protein
LFDVDVAGFEIATPRKINARENKPPSAKQVAQKELLKLASAYGNRVKLDPVLSAEHRPFCRGRMRPYHAAVRDFMVPPKVAAIDLQVFKGQPLHALAKALTQKLFRLSPAASALAARRR